MSTLSDNLKKCRKARDLSQEKAAQLLGIPRSRLGSYEEGRATPSPTLIPSLVDLYSIRDWRGFILNETFHPDFDSAPARPLSGLEILYNALDPLHKNLVDKLLKGD